MYCITFITLFVIQIPRQLAPAPANLSDKARQLAENEYKRPAILPLYSKLMNIPSYKPSLKQDGSS